MAFRGRGRGRGSGGYRSGGYGTPEPFILFPEDVKLPDINDVKEEKALVVANNKLQLYWKSSPYYLENPTKRKSEENDIERYSDRYKSNGRAKRLSLEHFLKLEDRYFPAELFQGKKKVEYNQSKGFSLQNKDELTFDKLELLEQKFKDRESKGGNETQKENESDNEEPEDEEESGEESPDEYEKPLTPDDDDDEYNQPEDDNPDDNNTYGGDDY